MNPYALGPLTLGPLMRAALLAIGTALAAGCAPAPRASSPAICLLVIVRGDSVEVMRPPCNDRPADQPASAIVVA